MKTRTRRRRRRVTGARFPVRKRLLITGCGGFVGGALVHQAGPGWDVHAVTRGQPLLERDGLTWHVLDLTDTRRLEDLFQEVSPSAVIHAAALTNIDYCEANREHAKRVNVDVTQDLTDLCRISRTRMVFVSTDNVFDGEKGRYSERDSPHPVNWYGETKATAERLVSALPTGWVVARVSVVMGLPMLGAGNSFLSRMIPILEGGQELGVPDDEVRSPIDVVTAARALLGLAGHDYSGYLHLAGNDILNRHEMVRRIAADLGYPPELVVAKSPLNIPGRAPRPIDASLDNAKARALLRAPMVGLEDGLRLVMAAKKGISG